MTAKVLENLEIQSHRLLQLLDSVDQEQLNTATHKDSWSAGQVGDHLYKSYNIMGLLQGKLLPSTRSPFEKIPAVAALFQDYQKKMDSPKALLPENKALDKPVLLDVLKTRLYTIRDFAARNDLSPLCMDAEFPGFGYFTRLEWIGFTAIHTQRHNHQLEKICQELGVLIQD